MLRLFEEHFHQDIPAIDEPPTVIGAANRTVIGSNGMKQVPTLAANEEKGLSVEICAHAISHVRSHDLAVHLLDFVEAFLDELALAEIPQDFVELIVLLVLPENIHIFPPP